MSTEDSSRREKDAFIGGYQYRWDNPQALYGSTHQPTPLDDVFDAGMLAAAEDQAAGRASAPEAAWGRRAAAR
jgi:hypothetical protein